MDEADLQSCPMEGFDISGVGTLGFATRKAIS